MKTNLLLALSLTMAAPAVAQRLQQDLGRGVVAVVRNTERSVTAGNEGCLVSWRRLAQEPEQTVYNLYVNGSLVTTTSGTCHVLTKINNGDRMRVVPVINGKEDDSTAGEFTFDKARQPYSNAFMKIEFEGIICHPDSFNAVYAWPADLDGDGEYDYVVAQVSRDRSVTNDKVQAYRSDGTHLWTIDMGPNVWICTGQNDMVVAYDIDCDGKAEVMIKSSEGTRFWNASTKAFGNYPFAKSVFYSFFITIVSSALILICTSMAAWYVARVGSFFSSVVYYLCVFSMVVPFQMVMFTLTKTADVLHLNTPWTIPVVYLGFGAGLAVFMFVGFVKSLPLEIEEAAAIDGCGPVRTFFSVVLPMLKPTLISVGVLEIMWVWNDYLLPYLVLDRTKYMTIPIHIQYLQGSYGQKDMGAIMALILLSIIPVIIFYLCCQKHIIKGVAAGAVKG